MVVDACSIINFAAINRVPLFETAMRGRGCWTEAVEGEVRMLSARHEYQSARGLLASGCLSDPLELDGYDDTEAVEDIRAALGGVSSAPLKHLGEAESIHVIETRPEFNGAIFLTDDRDATYLARRRGIDVRDTAWLVADAYSAGSMSCPEPFNVLVDMRMAARGVVVPAGHELICP